MAQNWVQELERVPAEDCLPAIERYKGAHWSVAKSCMLELGVELWIMSAGLGLINQNEHIPDYQATFSAGSDNSIPVWNKKRADSNSNWWQLLTEYKEHSFKVLFRDHSEDTFIVCGSKDYIRAVSADLEQAILFLEQPEKQLIIITSGNDSYPSLNRFLLRSREDMRTALQANMLSLNISLAKYFLSWLKQDTTKSLEDFKTDQLPILIRNAPQKKAKGQKQTESQVETYIKESISKCADVKVTNLLIMFRKEGKSFEEKRFKAVFKRVKP
ncbi:hypothetical protein K0H59_14965 [Shewanella sp. FJAT-51649]|uniref:hypothetical protein n=1 Tax=Shewanella sp. FJAT-51649 TaxID=2864210 RepID=UPI001C6603E3|nr:hypothetical protein [Shewanella sp. FJAT-51649]QYJ70322.1 hypothetical protein K0H59_14965 [Shewanella sp. FJAT-51649]